MPRYLFSDCSSRRGLATELSETLRTPTKPSSSREKRSLISRLRNEKRNSAHELEGWKAGYQKALDENRIRFSQLHADRAKVIKELFVHVVSAEEAVGAFVNPVRDIHDDEQKLQNEARTAFHDFSVFFTHNRILFTEANCLLIERIRNTAKDAYNDFTAFGIIPDARDIEARREWRTSQRGACDSMTGEFQNLRKQLEREFRVAMGMVEEPEAKDKQ